MSSSSAFSTFGGMQSQRETEKQKKKRIGKQESFTNKFKIRKP